LVPRNPIRTEHARNQTIDPLKFRLDGLTGGEKYDLGDAPWKRIPRVKTKSPDTSYALGYTSEEHSRLMRQAALVAPCTERLFHAAGISPGDRVLDLGSGVGDVSLLLGKLVGPSGKVVGVERDASSIARAQARIAAARLNNVSFSESDATEVKVSGTFDAVVGRFILMYLPNPARTLRGLATLLRPGGAVAFLEPSWAAVRGLSAHLPLYSAFATAIVETFKTCRVNPEMGTAMIKAFVDAGLPIPSMSMEVVFGSDEEFTRALAETLRSLEPMARRNGVSLQMLGDLRTLGERLYAEAHRAGDAIAWLAGNVGAWCRIPGDVRERVT
jgi:ubiquinone/menaquinone biosynthesis C-methylase UbiE